MPEVQSPKPEAQSQTPKKSGVVIPNAPEWYQRLAAFLIWLSICAVRKTIRFRLHDPHGFLQRKDDGPVIFCFWHNRLVLCMSMYAHFRREKYKGVVGLVSASKDGALLAAIFERFGVQAARGSSSRRGAQALRELATWTKRGWDLAITPDGPRGPRYVVADGVAGLAQITGLPIVPVMYNTNRKLTLKSWDAFQIPLPFSSCEITIGKIFHAPAGTTDAEREKIRQELEAELNAIARNELKLK
jgi:lysophospholipid acyltransferase (LPLAT)-like uncharacterized protein